MEVVTGKRSAAAASLPAADSRAVKRVAVPPTDTPEAHTLPPLSGFTILADAYGEKGVRKQMEDEHLICLSLRAVNPAIKPIHDCAVFGVFDGHGGRQSATFIRDNLPTELAAQVAALTVGGAEGEGEGKEEARPMVDDAPLGDKEIKKVVKSAFSKLDGRIATDIPSCRDGCTAVVVLLFQDKCYIANLGDSGAFLGRRKASLSKTHAIPLTEAHKPWVIAEKDRIIKTGGTIENGRVNGALEVTRSFGDISLKKYGVLCTPTFQKCTISPAEDEFLLLGCDGFWTCLVAEEAMAMTHDLVQKEMRRQTVEGDRSFDIKGICRTLVEYVLLDKKSQDNVSIVMIRLIPTQVT
ncbi:unnamed protein product [Vitrella brassicaformis CCMP3155]|uniref:protein-serine/threonine phosphatase n=1 Tax=Vitrella brassicaformis (strain CCMP3155) TaxID=1169540 RepID=A0A0G4ESD0_VITBC|nr:unnamed protein product [Vitrella brassicaformis CCMP3155]|eukprot:CEM01535.1 unnamed protein product [Vitrella brassicaformis CCMP3155]